MDIEEIEIAGVHYRGPFPTQIRSWKITALLPSSKRSTSGQRVSKSWQTWKKFATEREAIFAMHTLVANAGHPRAVASAPAPTGLEGDYKS